MHSPVRMALVGLGADDQADRMVSYLQEKGVDIALLTFHGYEHEGRTFLARQVERRIGSRNLGSARQARNAVLGSFSSIWLSLQRKRGTGELWRMHSWTTPDAPVGVPLHPLRESPFTDSAQATGACAAREAHGTHSVRLEGTVERIRITFYPTAVYLCQEKFEHQGDHSVSGRAPPNAPMTTRPQISSGSAYWMRRSGRRTRSRSRLAYANSGERRLAERLKGVAWRGPLAPAHLDWVADHARPRGTPPRRPWIPAFAGMTVGGTGMG